MPRSRKKSKQEIGISPYDLIFRGDKKTDSISMQCLDFDEDNLIDKPIFSVSEALEFRNSTKLSWLNVDGVYDNQLMEQFADGFELDRLILADVMNTELRPKLVDYDDCLFISIKMIQLDSVKDDISIENLSIVLTPSMLITFQEKPGDVFDPIRERIRKGKTRMRTRGADYLLFAILDVVIDNYLYVIGSLGEKIEALEVKLLPEPEKNVINQISMYKRELNHLRRNIQPAMEVVLALTKTESDLVHPKTYVHFKELQDNLSHAKDSSETYREILSDQLSIYHTSMSTKLNDIMKFLTIFSVIFIPLTFIAGIYGTNFDVLPEIHMKYGYFIMWAIMLIISIIMLIYFKRKKWL